MPGRLNQFSREVVLPAPDAFGNYWLGVKPGGAVIFRSGSTTHLVQPGKFFASRGLGRGSILLDDGGIRYFDTAREALDALEKEEAI